MINSIDFSSTEINHEGWTVIEIIKDFERSQPMSDGLHVLELTNNHADRLYKEDCFNQLMGPMTRKWEVGNDPRNKMWEVGDGQKKFGRCIF